MNPVFSYDRERESYRLQAQVWLPRARAEVFDFFCDAFNLETLTPAFLHFHVLTPRPIVMQRGSLIDYSLRLHRIPVRWQSEISEWEPPVMFVDRQVRGPYRLWHHEHRFEEQNGGTLCLDDIHYRVPGRALVHRLLVKADLARIFTFRQTKLLELFGDAAT
ncbi:MAG: CDP-paratose 2-epimerase [Planctomycetaceae bacterium]|nr:MAG: CDP-paratose 2-epimerase [Planctomycetaceae bacterium]